MRGPDMTFTLTIWFEAAYAAVVSMANVKKGTNCVLLERVLHYINRIEVAALWLGISKYY